jgi:hypothetical protein
MLLVRRNGEEDTITVHHTSAKLCVTHELPHLLRASKMSRQEALRIRHLLLEGRQAMGEWQPRRVARDRYPMYPLTCKAIMEMLV